MKSAKLIAAIVLFACAGIIFWVTSAGEGHAPDAPESRTAWKCAECDHFFELTSAEAAAEAKKAGAISPLLCPQCAKKEAYRVASCPFCSTYYFSADVPGFNGICPVCHPRESPIQQEKIENESRPERDRPPPTV